MNTHAFSPDPLRAFEAACRSFLTHPDQNTLLLLQMTAGPLTGGVSVPAAATAAAGNPWHAPEDHPGDWCEIRAEFDRVLTPGEVWLASGAIGYALRSVMAGEPLSDPSEAVERRAGDSKPVSVLCFSYDSTKSRRDDDHTAEAFGLAGGYVASGSPVRTTDRAGAGTKGTRLCRGIGYAPVTFKVR